MLSIVDGSLNVVQTLERWYDEEMRSNYGAFVPFIGTVRQEGGVEALSFDVYEPILNSWFDAWQKRAKDRGAVLKMAHSRGDVSVHSSSYISAVFSKKRRVALEMIDEFVEDFKANAPIWKYDVVDGIRIYAKNRSTPIDGSGLMKA